jgi:hypothetical protein
MNANLEVRIDGVHVTTAQIECWETRRARSVLLKLRRMLKAYPAAEPQTEGVQSLRAELVRLKEQCGRVALRAALRNEVRIAGLSSKLLLLLSGSGRKQCVTEVRVHGCSAAQISQVVDDLMCKDTMTNRQSNLLACPDHYLLEPRGDVLEVIESTGGSPFASQFFMRFDDESGLMTSRDPAFSFQSAGTARLKSGKIIGGVRHQFRDECEGAFVRLMVEFPSLTPQRMIREHQWHLACEFSHWLREAIKAAERAT